METILHVARRAELTRGGEEPVWPYAPAAYEREGFIHACTPGQLAGVARRFFAGADDLVLLALDAAVLDGGETGAGETVETVRWEAATDVAALFPHIYGRIPRGAVRAEAPFRVAADGSFAWPPAVARLFRRSGAAARQVARRGGRRGTRGGESGEE